MKAGVIFFIMVLLLTFVGCKKDKPEPSGEPSTSQDDRVGSDFEDSDHTFTVNGVEFTMKFVDGGEFMMGSQDTAPDGINYDTAAQADEWPIQPVTLSNFWIAETEVTQELWLAVMGSNQSRFTPSQGYAANLQRAIDFVSWDDICLDTVGHVSFLTRLNDSLSAELKGRRFELPTEAQWEYAAAGGKAGYNADGNRKYDFAGSNDVDLVAWYYDDIPTQIPGNDDYGPQPVKGKMPNALGLYDMSGNVYEWCHNYRTKYKPQPQNDPAGDEFGKERILRGGGWNSSFLGCRISDRSSRNPAYRLDHLGFRIAIRQ